MLPLLLLQAAVVAPPVVVPIFRPVAPATTATPRSRAVQDQLDKKGEEAILKALETLPDLDKKRIPRKGGSLAGLFTDDDYPAAALRKGEQGSVTVRLSIARSGVVTGCKVTQSSRSVALDTATCRILMLRARFAPLAKARGKPFDTYNQRIRWQISDDVPGEFLFGPPVPPPAPVALAPFKITASFTVRSGVAGRCVVQSDQAPPLLTASACADLAGAAARAIAARPRVLGEPFDVEITDRLRISEASTLPLAGEIVALRQAALLTIDGGGLVIGCEPLPGTLAEPLATAELCARARGIVFTALAGNPTDSQPSAWLWQTIVISTGSGRKDPTDPLTSLPRAAGQK